MTDWYEEFIETGVRDVVRLLRDNGFNTECSCEHTMIVQCSYYPSGSLQDLDRLLYDSDYRDYTITSTIERIDGHLRSFSEIQFRSK